MQRGGFFVMHQRMNLEEKLLSRLQALGDQRQINALAEKSGVEQSSINRAIPKPDGGKGQNLGLDKTSKILEAMGATVTFPDEIEAAPPTIRRTGEHSPRIVVGEGDKLVDVYHVAGAGQAWEIVEDDPIKSVRVPLSFVREISFAMLVRGDSMYPTMKSGSVAGVSSDKDFQHNEIYAVNIPYEGMAVKRVTIDHASNEYVLISDNPDKEKYRDIRINIETAPNLIAGRVVWVLQGV
jgi:phage repressor protein C with HTH and peptisase S24 domain